MIQLQREVISALCETFTPESFTRHLAAHASDTQAREQRAAEREALRTAVATASATEQRLVRRIAMVEDDALVDALKAEWAAAKGTREAAERRLGELDEIERGLAADKNEVEQLQAMWASWSATLKAAAEAPVVPGSVPAATARGGPRDLATRTGRSNPGEGQRPR